MKDAKDGDKSLNTDVSGMTADYRDPINNADDFIEMLGAGGSPEKGLSMKILDRNVPKTERASAFIELINEVYGKSNDFGKALSEAIEKFKESRNKNEKDATVNKSSGTSLPKYKKDTITVEVDTIPGVSPDYPGPWGHWHEHTDIDDTIFFKKK